MKLVLAAVLLCGCSNPPPPVATPVAAAPPRDAPPAARTVDVVDEQFGVRVADPYRWMEGDVNAERDAWLAAQGAYTTPRLYALPERAKLYARIIELGTSSSVIFPPWLANGRAFYRAGAPRTPTETLRVREPGKPERVVIDPGSNTIDNFAPSDDGARVAYNRGGGDSEVDEIRVVDVATGTEAPDVIGRVWSEFSASWLPDGASFLYTQMAPAASGVDPMLEMRVRLHKLGTPADRDPIVLMHGLGSFALEPQELPSLWIPANTPWVVAYISGARSDSRIAVARLSELDRSGAGKTPWRAVAGYDDEIKVADAYKDRLYLLTTRGAPNRRLVSVPLDHPDLAAARVELAESSDRVMRGFVFARDALYVNDMVAGRSRLRRVPWDTHRAEEVALPFDGALEGLVSEDTRAGVTIQLASWSHPPAQYAYDPAARTWTPNGVAVETPADFSAIVAEEVEATSADGERVPLSILRPRDAALDGSHPTILAGYAAYGSVDLPWFNPTFQAWIERGGVLAFCHGRGGGEKGDRWYRAGVRANKLTGVRDFIACGEELIARKLTTRKHLAATGASAGGILIGRAIVEEPQLFAAAAIQSGMVNPLRILHALNGANQVAELGSPDTADGFRQILAIDPYHQLDPAKDYPAMLFSVGLHDGRVAPWMSAKLAARMQARGSKRPVWLRVDADAGHGITMTADQAYIERADTWAFFLAQLGG